MTETTTCCIAGGGPAGMMLGLLLARSGVDVIVLEKHGDFLRDFRGDTIHPSTLEVLDEIGLGERFERLEHRKITGIKLVTDEGEAPVADLGVLRGRHPYIAMVPQWDFLDMLADAAARYPNFSLRMDARAGELVREGGRVTGLRHTDAEGNVHEIRAALTVAADGRNSDLRRAAGLRPREYGAPMDVAWFRLPRLADDPEDTFGRVGTGRMMVAINRTSYWQLAYLVPKGGFDRLRAEGVETLRHRIGALLPFLADRTADLGFDDVSVLDVRIDRLPRWHLPGLLFIGDAAHAMSPVGGVGINLAVQDAVAAANLLAGPLRRGAVTERDLAAVQRRRWLPTAAIQRFQILAQNALIKPTLSGARPSRPPRPLAVARRIPPVERLLARMLGHGPLPEHVRVPALPPPGGPGAP